MNKLLEGIFDNARMDFELTEEVERRITEEIHTLLKRQGENRDMGSSRKEGI